MPRDIDTTSFIASYKATFATSLIESDPLGHSQEAQQLFDELFPEDQSADNQQRCRRYKIPGAVPDDFAERVVDLGGGRMVLAGIRFDNGDMKKPFLAFWPSFTIDSIAALRTCSQAALEAFAVFAPRHIQVFTRPQSPLDEELAKAQQPRLLTFAGEVSPMAAQPAGASSVEGLPEGFTLERWSSGDFYQPYLALYQDLHQQEAARSNLPNDREDLAEAMAEGNLWVLKAGEAITGMIQGENGRILGKDGVYICDIIIHSDFRGRRLGARAQGELARQLPPNISLIHGEIAPSNLPSLRSAQRAGRQLIRKEYLVPTPHSPFATGGAKSS